MAGATLACVAGVVMLPAPVGAQTPPSCPAGIAAVPVFQAADPMDGSTDTKLTATHVIPVTAVFPDSAPPVDKLTYTGPPGLPVVTFRAPNARDVDIFDGNIGFKPQAPGPLPVSVSWQQSDGTRTGTCSGTAGTTFQILAARPLRPRTPRSSFSGPASQGSEYTWFTDVGKDADRRPLEIRVRSVRGAHLPGPRVAFKSTTIGLQPTDKGWQVDRVIRVPFLQVGGNYEAGQPGFLNLLVGMRAVTSNPKLGYELQIVQGRRLVGRIRAAGSCSAFGCNFTTFRVQR